VEPPAAVVATPPTADTSTLTSSKNQTTKPKINSRELKQLETDVESYITDTLDTPDNEPENEWKTKCGELEQKMSALLEENQRLRAMQEEHKMLLEENDHLTQALNSMTKRLALKTNGN
jgi:thiamine kinase-like enzyme